MKNLNKTLHYGVTKFMTNEKCYNCIISLKEDADYIIIESAFDEYFEKNKPYYITYETTSKKYDNSVCISDINKVNHVIDVGWCMYDHTNRKINNVDVTEISFVFKKIK